MDEDIKLYKEFLLGNKDAFDMLMNKYRLNVIYFIKGFVKKLDVAEDLAQDVFVYILINKKEYDFKYSMKTYLYTIAKCRALNYLKKEKRISYIEDNLSYLEIDMYNNLIEEEIYSNENKRKIHKAIDKLNKNQREILYLADIEELTYKDICKITGKSLSQVKMIIYRARKKLKIILEKEAIKNER